MKAEYELSNRLPEEYMELGIEWYKSSNFELVINRKRKTKQGDYRYLPREKRHIITVNENLNPWSFLVTYAHEIAHYRVYFEYGPGRPHHGREWKDEFRKLIFEILRVNKLPQKIESALASYARNPRASTFTYHPLVMALQSFDADPGQHLYDLSPGQSFYLNGKEYTFLSKRRTRALCQQVTSGKKYLISMAATIE